MGRFSAIICFVFVLGLMNLASPAPAPAPSPKAATPKASPVQSLAAPTPASPPTATSPASAPSKIATPPTSATSPAAQTPASGPSAEGPAIALPPSTSSGVISIPSMEKMAIFGTALLGGAAFLL